MLISLRTPYSSKRRSTDYFRIFRCFLMKTFVAKGFYLLMVFQVMLITDHIQFTLRRRETRQAIVNEINLIVHVRDGGFATGNIIDRAILGGDYTTIPGPDYRYFLLHKLIGDIVWMAGAAECLGLDALERDDDPWDGTHIVAPFSLLDIDSMLSQVQVERTSRIDNAP
jgi:hypothetical protein